MSRTRYMCVAQDKQDDVGQNINRAYSSIRRLHHMTLGADLGQLSLRRSLGDVGQHFRKQLCVGAANCRETSSLGDSNGEYSLLDVLVVIALRCFRLELNSQNDENLNSKVFARCPLGVLSLLEWTTGVLCGLLYERAQVVRANSRSDSVL